MNVHGMEPLLSIENTEGATFWCRDSMRNSGAMAFEADPLNHPNGRLKVNNRSVALVNRFKAIFRRGLISNRH